MTRPIGLLAVLAALLMATSPPTALAAGKLRSTIAQATPTPTPGDELSEDPGLPNSDDGSSTSGGGSDGADGDDLPNTGAEPLLMALMGLGLLGTGLGIRRRIAHGGLNA